MMLPRRAAFWLAGLTLLAACAEATPPAPTPSAGPTLLFSYEATPGSRLGLDLDDATYEQRAAVTMEVRDELVPGILTAAGLDPATVETQVTPGGFLLNTNASLQSQAVVPADQADRVAAALGYSFKQSSVLVTDFDAADGATGFATVSFPAGTLTAAQAQSFFEHAASVNEGLGGGYTAFGDDMIFINLRGGDGAPYSGLDDEEFISLLGQAAASFTGASVTVSDSGKATSYLVENDWEAAPAGEQYVEKLGPELTAALAPTVAAHVAIMNAAAAEYGWPRAAP